MPIAELHLVSCHHDNVRDICNDHQCNGNHDDQPSNALRVKLLAIDHCRHVPF